MSAKRTALVILTKMALADGRLDNREYDQLSELAQTMGEAPDIEDFMISAKTSTLDELIEQLDRYEDKFFVALRAFILARVDTDYSAEEETLYERLVENLGIKKEDRELIRRTEKSLRSTEEKAVHPRIEQMYAKSSFAGS